MKSKFPLLYFLTLLQIINVAAQPTYQVFSPKYSIMSGAYNHDLGLELYSESANSRIFYTLDETIPDSLDNLYNSPFLISGDQTLFKINAVTLDSANNYSSISSSYYRIAYSYDTLVYLTNLSVSDYQYNLVGHWLGNNVNPWTAAYNIDLTVAENSHYSAHAISCYKYPSGQEVCYPAAFYYGLDSESPTKVINVSEVNSSGIAEGTITIDYGGSTTNDELRKIQFFDNGNVLKMEMWHFGIYGPINYTMTRVDPLTTASSTIVEKNNISVFPNPAMDKLFIKNEQGIEIQKIEIRSISGSLLYSDNLINDYISTENLKKGIYFITAKDRIGNEFKLSFIKSE